MKRILLLLFVVALLLLGGIFLDPTSTLLGKLRGEKFFRSRPTSIWRAKIVDPNPAARQEAQKTLLDGGPDAVPILIQLLTESTDTADAAEIRWTAAGILGQIGPAAKDATPALLIGLKDADPHVRSVAIAALGSISAQPAEVVPKLVALLSTEQALAAIKALAAYGPDARAAVPELIRLLGKAGRQDDDIRWNAANTLGLIGPDAKAAIPALITALREDEDKEVREHSAESLGQIGSNEKETIDALIAGLRDRAPKVRRDSARSLGQIGKVANTALPALRLLAKDPDERVRTAAATAIERIEPRADEPRSGS